MKTLSQKNLTELNTFEHVGCTYSVQWTLPGFLGSDKVGNDKSLKKYKKGMTSGYVIGDGSLEETESKLNFRF